MLGVVILCLCLTISGFLIAICCLPEAPRGIIYEWLMEKLYPERKLTRLLYEYNEHKDYYIRHIGMNIYDKLGYLLVMSRLAESLQEPNRLNELLFIANESMNNDIIGLLELTLHNLSQYPNKESIMNEIRNNPNYLKFDNLEAFIGLPPLTQEQRKLLINKYRLNEIESDFTQEK